MGKHIAVKYFDTYPESTKYFDTKESAKLFIKKENDKLRNRPKTYWEYRGVREGK